DAVDTGQSSTAVRARLVNFALPSLHCAGDSLERFDESQGKRKNEHRQAEPDKHYDQVQDSTLHWSEHRSPHWLDSLSREIGRAFMVSSGAPPSLNIGVASPSRYACSRIRPPLIRRES